MIYLTIAVTGILLFVVLRTIHRLYLKVVLSAAYRSVFLRWFPVVELLLWTAYGFSAIAELFGDKSYYPLLSGGLILCVLVVAGWYFMRDFFTGFMIRSENSLEPGKPIRFGDTEGVIVKAGYRSLQLMNSAGEQLNIPYSMLAGSQLILPAESSKLGLKTISLAFHSARSPEKVQQLIMKRILEMPWVLTSVLPELEITLEEEQSYRVLVSLRVQNEEALLKTQAELTRFVEKEL